MIGEIVPRAGDVTAYDHGMAPPPFVVAVVGSHEHVAEAETAAWVAARDIAWRGAWVAVDVGGSVAAAAVHGARQHAGVVLGFLAHEYRDVTADGVDVSLVIRTGLPSPLHAAVLAANADALLAFPGDAKTMAAIAAAHERGIPVAQIGTTDWPARPLPPTEVPAWLDEQMKRRDRAAVPAAPAEPPPPPDLTDVPGPEDIPASESEEPANTTSSSSTASDATSSPSPTTATNETASTTATATE